MPAPKAPPPAPVFDEAAAQAAKAAKEAKAAERAAAARKMQDEIRADQARVDARIAKRAAQAKKAAPLRAPASSASQPH
jgi:hypothetical protein